MELNLQAQKELKRLKVLSAQIEYAEKHLVELFTNRPMADECGEDPHILHRYDDLIENVSSKIEVLKIMIVEHVNVLVALTDAQGED